MYVCIYVCIYLFLYLQLKSRVGEGEEIIISTNGSSTHTDDDTSSHHSESTSTIKCNLWEPTTDEDRRFLGGVDY